MANRVVKEIFDFLGDTRDYKIEAADLDGNVQTVITSANTVHYMRRKYAERKYTFVIGGTVTDDEIDEFFNEDFRMWVANRQHNIDKQYQALFDYDYSPIENVDRYESEIIDETDQTTYGKRDTESGSDALQHGHVVSRSGTNESHDTGTDTNTKTGNVVNETEKAGYNAPNSYTNDTKNTETYNTVRDATAYGKNVTGSDSSTETNSGTDTTTYGKINTASGTDATDHDSERTLRVHGNIGVTTNTELLGAELELRKVALSEMLIDNFINDYTYYS